MAKMIAKTGKGTVVTGKPKSKPETKPVEKPKAQERVAVISTSDRASFKSCRRKWNWQSPLRQSLSPMEQKLPLWFGSGMHHALEDYHGKKLYASPLEAIDDYVQATTKHYGEENIPHTATTDTELMKSMLLHYTEGFIKLRGRDPYKTYKIKGEPQVEIPFEFEIPLPAEFLERAGYTKAIYRGVLDRMVIDEDGYLWIQDYKNIAQFTTPEHLELDMQIGVYLWAASYIYQRPVMGFIYTQFLKSEVQPPRILKSGDISTDSSQNTTHALYREALIEKYGQNSDWPEKNIQVLNQLATLESEDSDKFIRRDRVIRSANTRQAESEKILAEVMDMLEPTLRVYPNPSFMCPRMCSFMEPCLAWDRGENYRAILKEQYTERKYTERNDWRKYLKVGEKTEKDTLIVKPEKLEKKNDKKTR